MGGGGCLAVAVVWLQGACGRRSEVGGIVWTVRGVCLVGGKNGCYCLLVSSVALPVWSTGLFTSTLLR